VGIGVQGDRDLGVAQAFLDDLGVDALGEEQGGGRVAQVVEADAGEVRFLEERGEGTSDEVALAQGPALGVAKHERRLPMPLGEHARAVVLEGQKGGLVFTSRRVRRTERYFSWKFTSSQ